MTGLPNALRFSRRVRLLVDTLIVGLAFVVALSAAEFWQQDSDDAPAELVQPGRTLAFDGSTEWARGASRNVVVRAKATCHACVESETFFEELSELILNTSHARLIVVSPDLLGETRMWLETSGIHVDGIQQWDEEIVVYPTTFLVDETGTVTNMWLGAMSLEEEETLLAMIVDPIATDERSSAADFFPPVINEVELNRLQAKSRVTVVDPRERVFAASGAQQDSVNIPSREWSSRMLAEYLPTDVIVVDCTYVNAVSCQGESAFLKHLMGFHYVYRLQRNSGR